MPWPATLPPLTETFDYGETLQEGYFESRNEGPKKRRPKTIFDPVPLNFNILVTSDQKDDLEDFYDEELSGGALPFEEFHPRTGKSAQLQFKGPIQFPHAGGQYYRAIFQLEVLS